MVASPRRQDIDRNDPVPAVYRQRVLNIRRPLAGGAVGRKSANPERFRAKACPGRDPGWIPVRVKKTRQNKEVDPSPPVKSTTERQSPSPQFGSITLSSPTCEASAKPRD